MNCMTGLIFNWVTHSLHFRSNFILHFMISSGIHLFCTNRVFFFFFKCKQSITKVYKLFQGLWHSLFMAFYCINHYNHNISVIQQLHLLNHISRQYKIFFRASMHLHYFKNRAIYVQFSFYPQALIMMYRVLTEMTLLEYFACFSLHHS